MVGWAMPKIFISYRREDSQWPVDRIHAALKPRVADPKADIFVDVDNIPVGVDFAAHLDAKVAQCDVLLAVIGKEWLDIRNPRTGERRLDDPKDFVRIEIASALKRGIPVAPVLLDDARLPEPADLPEDLRPLVGRQGVEISRMTFDADVERLINGLGLGRPAAQAPASGARKAAAKTAVSTGMPTIAGAALALVVGDVAILGFTQGWFGGGEQRVTLAEDVKAAAPAAAPVVDAGEAAAWRMADALKSPESYTSYLADYPAGPHVGDANAALARFADDAAWTRAAGRGRADLDAYLAAHPSGAHAQAARDQIAAIITAETAAANARSEAERKEIDRKATEQRDADRRAAEREADDNAWTIASSANSIASYQRYISAYPTGANVSKAYSNIAALERPRPPSPATTTAPNSLDFTNKPTQ